MDKITESLKKIGLSETEVKIYLAGLSENGIGVSELAKQTQIQRTTIYHALETLEKKGLVGKKGTGRRLVFVMIQPKKLESLLDARVESLKAEKAEIQKIIPLLEQRKASVASEVRVTQFDGIEGIKMVVEEALYAKSRKWDILAPSKNFFSEFDKAYSDYFMGTRKTRGIKTRSLWEHDPNRRVLTQQDIKDRQPRFLPKDMQGKFGSVFILFDDKVAIISSLNELSAILIQSQEIHNTMAVMFEGLWLTAEPYEKIVKKA